MTDQRHSDSHPGPVLAANHWPTNGHLIVDCARLGYLNGQVLDPTYGRGVWWRRFRPEWLTVYTNDHDFRSLPEKDESFDSIVYDPPYVSPGGRSTTGIPEFFKRFGMDDCPRTPEDLQRLIEQGMDEMHRLLRPGGFLLQKTKCYISSGKFFPGTYLTQKYAMEVLGMEPVDRFEVVRPLGPQSQKRQVHARRNVSTLLVFRKTR